MRTRRSLFSRLMTHVPHGAGAGRTRPTSRWIRSFIASISALGGNGARSAAAFASRGRNVRRRLPRPRPSSARASSNRFDARRSKGVPSAETSKGAARLPRASPRSARRTTSRTCSRCCSLAAFIGLPLAQKCTLRRDTPKSRPTWSQVSPDVPVVRRSLDRLAGVARGHVAGPRRHGPVRPPVSAVRPRA